jgi:heptosyltransferase-1
MPRRRILIVRLGAMGDIVHALPAVAALRRTFPGATIDWAIHPKWRGLLDANPLGATPVPFDRHNRPLCRAALAALRAARYDVAVDLQGLVQSALVGRLAHPAAFYGYDPTQAREWAGALLYTHPVRTRGAHVVERCLELAEAAGARAGAIEFPLPPGAPEGELPDRFVLACPLAGWRSKQWPLEYYAPLARRLRDELGLALVLNGAPSSAGTLRQVELAVVHLSGIAGLIDATRRATLALGLDSGPMHLAAALAKPGVALFGPTDPARNGPYGGSLDVLRDAGAVTTYRRGAEIDPAMRRLSPDLVFEGLRRALSGPQDRSVSR